MANEIRLEVYTFRVRERNEVEKYLTLDEFAEGGNFIEFFKAYIRSFDSTLEVDQNKKRALKLQSKNIKFNSGGRFISGIIESGDYGTESNIVDTNTGQFKYKKSATDSDIKPFYFLLYLPKEDDKGFLVLQRHGIYGINGVFTHHLAEFFKAEYPELMIEFSQFVSRRLAEKFINEGSIREFILTRYNLPPDVADVIGLKNQSEDIMAVELRIVARKQKQLSLTNKVKKFINNPNAAIFTSRAFAALGFDGEHKSKIKVEMGGQTRTIDLSDSFQLRPYYDIDNKVDIDKKTGHPIFESIDSAAKSLISDLEAELLKK